MGNYLNPGNSGFATIRNSTYVDKTGMIYLINKTIDTTEKLTCISRPRRFGKSFAAKMLCAYYDRSCDSSALFDDLEIAADQNYAASYHEYLNQYDVIYLDMTAIIGETSFEDLVPYIKRNIIQELNESYPEMKISEGFVPTLANTVEMSGTKFIMIIDEWDAPIREGKDTLRYSMIIWNFCEPFSRTAAPLTRSLRLSILQEFCLLKKMVPNRQFRISKSSQW